jgi:hypothetical protein
MAVKVLPFKHKGQDVFICTGNVSKFIDGRSRIAGCATVVENLNSSVYFPQGYHYDVCPNCGADLDYTEPVKIERTKFNETDYALIAKLAAK